MRHPPDTFAELLWDGGWRIAVLSAALGLLLWGWFALTLSPVERYYFPAYVGSSLHIFGSQEQDRAVWILKARPKNKFEVADPQDLVPVAHGTLPFVLSKEALAQGWTGTDSTVLTSYPAGSQRLFLRQDFFGNRSLLDLLSPPLELLALPFSVWFGFVFWRRKRDQERGSAWVWLHGETSWPADAWQFTREMAEAVGFIAVGGWGWLQAGHSAVMKLRASGSVSSSIAAAPEKKAPLAAEPKVVAVVTAPSLNPEPIQCEPDLTAELPRAQTLPFRKRQAVQSGEKWDESKWIE